MIALHAMLPARRPGRRTTPASRAARAGALLLALAAAPAYGHHSVLGFDGSRAVVVSGTVREVRWSNPHVYLAVDTGTHPPERWVIEIEGSTVLQRLGWTETSVRPGDRLRSTGAPARDGRRLMRCQQVEPLATGARLPCVPER